MNFDKYHIGQNFAEVEPGCQEFSLSEYKTIGPSMPHEKIYHGQSINFCGVSWSSVIGVVKNRIYKISLQHAIEIPLGDIFEKTVWNNVYEKFNDEIGLYTDQEKKDSCFLTYWDSDWGNVILSNATYQSESLLETTNVIDVVATGKFAFTQRKRIRLVGSVIVILVGAVSSFLLGNWLGNLLLILVGTYAGRKIDEAIARLILKGYLKKAPIFIICILWGSALALWVRVLILYYDPNLVLIILCYMSGIYISSIFYQDKRIGQMAKLLYGNRIKTVVNLITLIAYLLMSAAFSIILK